MAELEQGTKNVPAMKKRVSSMMWSNGHESARPVVALWVIFVLSLFLLLFNVHRVLATEKNVVYMSLKD